MQEQIFTNAMLVLGRQATWVGLMALFPLILLMITGLYMFALPYLGKSRTPSPARDAA